MKIIKKINDYCDNVTGVFIFLIWALNLLFIDLANFLWDSAMQHTV